MSEPSQFDEILLASVDHGLGVLGGIVRQTIYDRIETRFDLERDEIPQRPNAFHQALEEILGAGAKVVERLIAKDLYGRLGLAFAAHEDWTLEEYLNHVKAARLNGIPGPISGDEEES